MGSKDVMDPRVVLRHRVARRRLTLDLVRHRGRNCWSVVASGRVIVPLTGSQNLVTVVKHQSRVVYIVNLGRTSMIGRDAMTFAMKLVSEGATADPAH